MRFAAEFAMISTSGQDLLETSESARTVTDGHHLSATEYNWPVLDTQKLRDGGTMFH
jgi:hypothetical protein